jgi:2-methylisocitrate lyase-like PEP mutase family enzyme
LPQHIDRVSVASVPDLAEGRFYAVVTPATGGSFNAEVIDTAGYRYVQLSGYRTVALPGAVDAERLKTLQSLISAEEVTAA